MNPIGMNQVGDATNFQPQGTRMTRGTAPKEINYGGYEQVIISAKEGEQLQGAEQRSNYFDNFIEQVIKKVMEEIQTKSRNEEQGTQFGGGQGTQPGGAQGGALEDLVKQVLQKIMGGLGN